MSLVAIFDVDGTLVDTNYQHTLAWYRAFRNHGVVIPVWQIHRAIGLGSDRVVQMLAGKEVERELGETLRAAQGPLYQEMIDEVEPTNGARDLLSDLKQAGHSVILASSAEEEDIERYIKLLDVSEFVDGYTTSSTRRSARRVGDRR
jgi:beta-phosphoglucomutase-like phosphatase (HAD superfamily)